MCRNQRNERSMAGERTLPRGLYLIAWVLLGTTALLTSPAAKARPSHYHGTHSRHLGLTGVRIPVADHGAVSSVREPQDHRAPKTGNSSAGAATQKGGKQPNGASAGTAAKDSGVPDFQPKDLGPIDTRITVQPRLHGAGPGTPRLTKSGVGPISSRYSHVHHGFTSARSSHLTRNAIGLPVAPPITMRGPNNGVVRAPIGALPGVEPSASYGAVKTNPGPGPFGVSRPGSVVNGLGAQRAGINGNSFGRRGFVPANLGGPTKNVVVGIDGSTIRPKH
jgi:hypothetical protein